MAKRKKDGWFFSKNILEEINSMPDEEEILVEEPIEVTEAKATKKQKESTEKEKSEIKPSKEPVLTLIDSQKKVENEITNEDNLLASLSAENERLTQQLTKVSIDQELVTKLQAENQQIQRELINAQAAKRELMERLREKEDKIPFGAGADEDTEILKKQLNKARIDMQKIKARLEARERTLIRTNQKVDQLIVENNDLNRQLSEKVQQFSREKIQQRDRISQLEAVLNEEKRQSSYLEIDQYHLKEQLQEKEEEIAALNQREDYFEKYQAAKEALEELKTTLTEKTDLANRCQQDLAAIQQELSKAKTNLTTIQKEKLEQEAITKNIEEHQESIESENSSLKEELEAAQQEMGKLLMNARKQAQEKINQVKIEEERKRQHLEEQLTIVQTNTAEILDELDVSKRAMIGFYEGLEEKIDLTRNKIN